jgi:hypothetical protein
VSKALEQLDAASRDAVAAKQANEQLQQELSSARQAAEAAHSSSSR